MVQDGLTAFSDILRMASKLQVTGRERGGREEGEMRERGRVGEMGRTSRGRVRKVRESERERKFTYLMLRTSDEGFCIPLLSKIGKTFSTTLGPDMSSNHYITMTSLDVSPWFLPAVGFSQALMVTL